MQIIQTKEGENLILEDNLMRVARSSQKITIPKELDKDLAYLTGYHFGDGYLEDLNKSIKNRGKPGYEIDYADKSYEQINLINQILKQKFNHNLKIYKRIYADTWIGRSACKALHWFMNEKLEIPQGRATLTIPKWILTKKEFLTNFISGFFDAEGDISKTTNNIVKGKRYYKLRIQIT